jgi:hypothetical protein
MCSYALRLSSRPLPPPPRLGAGNSKRSPHFGQNHTPSSPNLTNAVHLLCCGVIHRHLPFCRSHKPFNRTHRRTSARSALSSPIITCICQLAHPKPILQIISTIVAAISKLFIVSIHLSWYHSSPSQRNPNQTQTLKRHSSDKGRRPFSIARSEAREKCILLAKSSWRIARPVSLTILRNRRNGLSKRSTPVADILLPAPL